MERNDPFCSFMLKLLTLAWALDHSLEVSLSTDESRRCSSVTLPVWPSPHTLRVPQWPAGNNSGKVTAASIPPCQGNFWSAQAAPSIAFGLSSALNFLLLSFAPCLQSKKQQGQVHSSSLGQSPVLLPSTAEGYHLTWVEPILSYPTFSWLKLKSHDLLYLNAGDFQSL